MSNSRNAVCIRRTEQLSKYHGDAGVKSLLLAKGDTNPKCRQAGENPVALDGSWRSKQELG